MTMMMVILVMMTHQMVGRMTVLCINNWIMAQVWIRL